MGESDILFDRLIVQAFNNHFYDLNACDKRVFGSKDLAIIAILSALGGSASVLIGYGASFLSQIPMVSSIGGQFFSGIHIFWLILAAIVVKKRFSASITGALKGLVEMILFSHIGIFAFAVSFIEGLVVDLVFAVLKKDTAVSRYLAAGFASASNIMVLYFFFFPQIQIEICLLMHLASFLSGLVFGGYLANYVLRERASLMLHTHWVR